jgi:hypothetical protein
VCASNSIFVDLEEATTDNLTLNNTVVAMGRVIRNQRKGRGSIFTANTRLNKAPAQFRTLDYVRPPAHIAKNDQHWDRGLMGTG